MQSSFKTPKSMSFVRRMGLLDLNHLVSTPYSESCKEEMAKTTSRFGVCVRIGGTVALVAAVHHVGVPQLPEGVSPPALDGRVVLREHRAFHLGTESVSILRLQTLKIRVDMLF